MAAAKYDADYFPEADAPTRKRRGGGTSKRATKGASGSPYTSVPLPPCKVCGGCATGYHFGVITCEACKAFFRRALIHKHDYKCLKEDRCQITDKKLGNCSACRLRKCFELGMSKGGVRRGRYSIAIRTQAILEAKAREATDVVATAAKKRRHDDTFIEEISDNSTDNSLPFDVFDGLLDIADLNDYKLNSPADHMRMMDEATPMFADDNVAVVPTVYVEDDNLDLAFHLSPEHFSEIKSEILDIKPDLSSSPTSFTNPEPILPSLPSPSHTTSEIIIQMKPDPVMQLRAEPVKNRQLEFLIDAVMSCQDAVYPSLKRYYNENFQDEHFKIFVEYNKKQEMFGDLFGTSENSLSTAEFQQIFAETGLDLDDRLGCFNKKGKSMEETIAQYVNFAKLVPGFKSLHPKDVAKLLKAAHFEFWMLGNFMLLNKELGVSSSWDGSHKSSKKTMLKFFDEDIIEACFLFSDRLKALNLTLEEIALIRLIILTYTDRCSLIDTTKIQSLQEKFVECLHYHLQKTVPNPGKRMSQIFNTLLAMRDVTHLNIAANKKFLQEWDFLMHDYPLWKEMLSYDGES